MLITKVKDKIIERDFLSSGIKGTILSICKKIASEANIYLNKNHNVIVFEGKKMKFYRTYVSFDIEDHYKFLVHISAYYISIEKESSYKKKKLELFKKDLDDLTHNTWDFFPNEPSHKLNISAKLKWTLDEDAINGELAISAKDEYS